MYSVGVVPLFVFNIELFLIRQLLPQTLPIYLESCQCCCLKELCDIKWPKILNKEIIEKFAPLLILCIYIQNCKLFIGTRDTKHASTLKLYFPA